MARPRLSGSWVLHPSLGSQTRCVKTWLGFLTWHEHLRLTSPGPKPWLGFKHLQGRKVFGFGHLGHTRPGGANPQKGKPGWGGVPPRLLPNDLEHLGPMQAGQRGELRSLTSRGGTASCPTTL